MASIVSSSNLIADPSTISVQQTGNDASYRLASLLEMKTGDIHNGFDSAPI